VFKNKIEKKNNIYYFNTQNTTSQIIQNFYERNPFPSYSSLDDKHSIKKKGENNFLANQIKKNLGNNKKILEVGAGTCQISNFLALGTNNQVVAFDVTKKSLEHGSSFATKNDINNVSFVCGDIFQDIFQDNFFDFIWCNGVLHHTKSPKQGFKNICKYLKKNGLILVGLYNKYGRFRTVVRQKIYKILGKDLGKKYLEYFDPMIKDDIKKDKNVLKAWIQDQYEHPVESLHTFDEIISWFSENNIKPIASLPSLKMYNHLNEDFLNDLNLQTDLRKNHNFCNKFNRTFTQLRMNLNSLGRDGGLFILVGKKL
tara:strand:- start:7 stop:945 length:939 start_codon:yes stop_codon:yes gene_type:complete